MSHVKISILGNENQDGMLKLTPSEYEQRIHDEIDKFYANDKIRASQDVNDLSFAEKTDVLSTENAYQFLTPAKVIGKTGNINLLNQGQNLWEGSRYSDLYQEALVANAEMSKTIDVSNSNLSTLASLGVTVRTKPKPRKKQKGTSEKFISAEKVVGKNSEFKRSELLSFEKISSVDPTEAKIADDVVKKISKSLTKSSKSVYDSKSVPTSNLDFTVSDNVMNVYLRNPGPANTRSLFNMPPAFKSVILSRSKDTRRNVLDSSNDFFSDSETEGCAQFNYFETYHVEMLEKFNSDTKSPTYRPLTKDLVDQLKQNGGAFICRMRKYDSKKIFPDSNRNLSTKLVNQYFLIESEPQKATVQSNAKMLNNTTPFGADIMRYLLAANFLHLQSSDSESEPSEENEALDYGQEFEMSGIAMEQESALAQLTTATETLQQTQEVGLLNAQTEQSFDEGADTLAQMNQLFTDNYTSFLGMDMASDDMMNQMFDLANPLFQNGALQGEVPAEDVFSFESATQPADTANNMVNQNIATNINTGIY